MKRRRFISTGMNATLAATTVPLIHWKTMKLSGKDPVDERSYLSDILYTKEEVEAWLAGKAFPFSKYHARFGWLLNSASFRDGIDDSVTSYTYEEPDGERIMSNYRDKACRINTYGDSFTQCHQVSDHETWQEILAAHLQEPVRNFGIGGWSVYQAYLRMLHEEQYNPAEFIIFNIYEDDHRRNLDAWRNIRVSKHPQHIEATLPYVKVDMANDRIIECENPCPTPESVFDLCDLDKTCEHFHNDFVLNIMIAHRNGEREMNDSGYEALSKLVKTHGIETRLDKSVTLDQAASEIHWNAALFSSRMILEKITSFIRKRDKRILFVLSYPGSSVARYILEGKREDAAFVSYLQANNLPYMDLLEKHASDFSEHKLSVEKYIQKYFMGHYTPLGNFFCAHNLKAPVVEMLNPPPEPYLPI